MGPGYVVAALLEGAGLSGLVLAAVMIRTERKTRVAELRNVLRSGQSAVAAAGPALQNRWRVSAPRVVNVPVVTANRGAGRLHESAARSALGRAFARTNPPAARALSVSISAE